MHMEKIYDVWIKNGVVEKHLHAHGENSTNSDEYNRVLETPPCTWRKSSLMISSAFNMGNTSMHMEKIMKSLF